MQKTGKFLRTLALSLLSGGSTAIVFAAIVLVKAAQAHGVPVAEAAANNAPAFLEYSKVALGAAIMLGIGELIGYRQSGARTSKLELSRLCASIACIVCVAIFAFGIVPTMTRLLPDIKTVTEAHDQFRQLHEISRAVFGASILFAFVSMLLPIFKSESVATSPKIESKVLL